MLEEISKYILGEWHTIASTPVTFILAVLAVGVLIWWATNWGYGREIKYLERQLADYRDKLSGATPDQAKARIDELESQVTALKTSSARSLSAMQGECIAANINDGDWRISIYYNPHCFDCADYARQFAEIIGRGVNVGDFQGGPTVGKTGLLVGTRDLSNPTQAASMLIAALRAAKLEFSMVQHVDPLTMHPLFSPGRTPASPPNVAALFIMPRS